MSRISDHSTAADHTPEYLQAYATGDYLTLVEDKKPVYADHYEPDYEQILDELLVVLSFPGDFYRRVLADHLKPDSPLQAGLISKLTRELKPIIQRLTSDPYYDATYEMFRRIETFKLLDKYQQLLILLLKRGVAKGHVLALLKTNPQFMLNLIFASQSKAPLSHNKEQHAAQSEKEIAQLHQFIEAIKAEGITDAELLALTLPAKTDSAALVISTEPDTTLSSITKSYEPDLSFIEEELRKAEETIASQTVRTPDFRILKLISAFPADALQAKAVNQLLEGFCSCLHTYTYRYSMPFSLSHAAELLEFLVNAGVPAKIIMQKMDLEKTLTEAKSYDYNLGLLPIILQCLLILAKKDSTLDSQILDWLVRISMQLSGSHAFDEKFVLFVVKKLNYSSEAIHFVKIYLSLVEHLSPEHLKALKAKIYQEITNSYADWQGRNYAMSLLSSDVSLTASCLIETPDNLFNKLTLICAIGASDEVSFDQTLAILNKMAEKLRRFDTYSASEFFQSCIKTLNKDPSTENAKRIYNLLNSPNLKFDSLDLPYRDESKPPVIAPHLVHFFNLQDMLKAHGISAIERQRISNKISYNITNWHGEVTDKVNLSYLINRRINDQRDSQFILKILTANHCGTKIIEGMAASIKRTDIADHIESLPIEERYQLALEVITGEGSLAYYFEQHPELLARKTGLLKTEIARLYRDIAEGKLPDAQLKKLTEFKEDIINLVLDQPSSEEKFQACLQAHDATTPIGRYLTLATFQSAEPNARKDEISPNLTEILEENIEKVYQLIGENSLTGSQTKGLAFLKEKVALYIQSLPEPDRLKAHIDAIFTSTPLGQYFYLPRSENSILKFLDLATPNTSRGVLKLINDELKKYKPEIIWELIKDARVDQLAQLASLENNFADLWARTLTNEQFWDCYLDTLNPASTTGKYYFAINDCNLVYPNSAVMQTMNAKLLSKPQLFLEKLRSGNVKAEWYPAYHELLDKFLENARSKLSNTDYKQMLKEALAEGNVLNQFFSKKLEKISSLLAQANAVKTSATMDELTTASPNRFSLFNRPASRIAPPAPQGGSSTHPPAFGKSIEDERL